MNQIIINAENGILGRVAAFAAKQALVGKSVIVVNCEKALLTGRKKSIIAEYMDIRRKGGASLKGPFFPKHSDRIMKRTIRGMLPYKQQRGADALKRVLCYNGVPKEFESAKKQNLERDLKVKTMTLEDLSREI